MLITELQERYSITRKPLYSRINVLNLKLSKNSDNKSFATPEQVEILDQLDEHLKAGGTLKSFVPVTDVEVDNTHDTRHDTDNNTATQITTRHDKSNDIGAIETTTRPTTHTTQLTTQELLAQMAMLITEAKDPLWNLTALERARASSWLLTTAQVKNLIGVKPSCKGGKNSYRRGNFIFVKSGKIGNQTAWRVLKEAEPDGYNLG